MGFEFATAGRIIFGDGVLAGVGAVVKEFGRHAAVVTGRDVTRAEPLLTRLRAAEIAITLCPIDGEPTIDAVSQATEVARGARCDLVIGFGGGSALDAAKAIAALLANPGDPFDYLEVIGRAQALTHPALPCVAIPTTAGTGSESTLR